MAEQEPSLQELAAELSEHVAHVARIPSTYRTARPEQMRQVMRLVERSLDSETSGEGRTSRFRREVQAAIDTFTALYATSVAGADAANMQTDRTHG